MLLVQSLSGTESAILNRESSDSESGDSNRAIPSIDRMRFWMAILNRFSMILPSGAPGLHALLNYFGINFRFDYTYTYTFNCLGN